MDCYREERIQGVSAYPPKRCSKGLGRVMGVSKSLRCPEMGIVRRLLRHSMSGVSQRVLCETSVFGLLFNHLSDERTMEDNG